MSPERESDQSNNPEKNKQLPKKQPADGSRPKPGSKPVDAGSGASDEATPEKAESEAPLKEEAHPDPTRFGDWEKKGRCIDF